MTLPVRPNTEAEEEFRYYITWYENESAAASFAFKTLKDTFRQRIIEIVRHDEITFCQSDRAHPHSLRERTHLRYGSIFFKHDDRFAIKYAMEIFARIFFDLFDRDIHRVRW